MTRLAFLDTETTGIDPRTSWLWEFAAIIVDSVERSVTTLHWEYGPTALGALPEALEVSRYHERHHAPPGRVWAANAETRALLAAPALDYSPPSEMAAITARALSGAVIVGANPHFDTGFVGAFLEAYGVGPTWDYHLENIGSRIGGFLAARGVLLPPGSKADRAYQALGLVTDPADAHTALGDARTVRRAWDVMESPVPGPVSQRRGTGRGMLM